MSQHHGPAGKLASIFTNSKLTLLGIIAILLLGIMAIWLTPREEEPQIMVPMVDIMVPFNGVSPAEVEKRIVDPAEKILWGIEDVEYIYSTSRSEGALITLRFKVGTPLEPAVLRVHHKLREHMPEKPEDAGFPLIRSYTIDDVPFLAMTFHGGGKNSYELRKIAKSFSEELSEIPDISYIEILGGEPRTVRVIPDPLKLKQRGISLAEFFEPLKSGNVQGNAGVTEGVNPEAIIEVGGFIKSAEEVSEIVIGIKGGQAVRIKDVADVVDGPADIKNKVLFKEKNKEMEPAVTIAFTKRPGTNATLLVNQILEKADKLKDKYLQGASYDVTRNYGKTAKEKSDELIKHLLIASLSVVILIAIALGIRFALVVGIAVPVTLALTLLIYYLFGYTLNRVTLFALIFSIGILVDDAIVVIENIHRHLHSIQSRSKSLKDIIVESVAEVGNPTILATFTVIAAILPMAFVRGLMGPYMRPIPIGASLAMVFSLVVAFTISPWGALKLHRRPFEENVFDKPETAESKKSILDKIYYSVMGSLLDSRKARFKFLGVIVVSFILVFAMIGFKLVRIKMLPFDNKSEFQVIVDMDEGNSLSSTEEVSKEIGKYLETVPEVENYQIYTGINSPINFNGLVRHYFLRRGHNQADIQVNLQDKHERSRQSHDIAKGVRSEIVKIAEKFNARAKIVEIPPGPPVLSTLVAEVYGPDHNGQIEFASKIKDVFKNTNGVVDVDWMVEYPQEKFILQVDRKSASLRNVPVERIYNVISAAVTGATAGLIHESNNREPVPVNIRLPEISRKDVSTILDLTVPAVDGSFVSIKDLVNVVPSKEAPSIYHKNLQRVVYVVGDMAGKEESPIYGIFKMNKKIEPPKDYSMKWDGEWQISYEVFRDLGIAFAVVMILIYILVVGWFESYLVPIVIMLPIPLSLIGIIPGHFIFGAFFTATSMIGFIAGAGIIVRNSIILVDFIELRIRQGMPLKEAVIDAGAVRFRPMLLTAAAVVVAGVVILFDPIFQGLAISLMMGEVAATLLSRLAVPLCYYLIVGKIRVRQLKGETI